MAMTGHDFVVEAKAQITEVTADEARQLVARGAVVLDVREADEHAAGHLPGAINIPRGVLEFRVGMVPQLHNRQHAILVYCKTSGRAALSTVVLHRMGYPKAVSLAGGFDLWLAQSRPVEKPEPVNFE